VAAYISLLQIAQASGSTEQAKAIEMRATVAVPTTYYVRHVYLTALQPRWGGSYEEMQQYEAGLNDAARTNPRIWSLKGDSWGERGRSAWQQHEEMDAISYYTTALQFGDRLEFLKARASLYINTRQYELALKDLVHYRAYDPTNDEVNQDTACMLSMHAGRPCAPASKSNGVASQQ
jgi:hypothetical protein